MNSLISSKLPKDFYQRDAAELAPDLIGKIFCRKLSSGIIAGRIVEVEAYDGRVDEASHSFGGITRRNEVMFGGGGFLYVYFTYGMYYCCNVVAGIKGTGQGVLIRGIEPIEGIALMSRNRYGRRKVTGQEKINLTSGPGKICIAFGITKKNNGVDLTGDRIFLAEGGDADNFSVVCSQRIGIKKSRELEWRFFIEGNNYVTKHKLNKTFKTFGSQ